jgi:hypothetical protein
MMVYKYLSAERFVKYMGNYLAGQLYFADWHTFNDPKEGHYYRGEKLTACEVEELKDDKSNLIVCATAKNPDSPLFWSRYGNCYKGVCIGIDTEDNEDMKIGNVHYNSDLPVVNSITSKANQAVVILMTKTDGWENEDEWRFIKHADDKKPKMIKIGTTKKIIFGCNHETSPEEIKRIREYNRDIEIQAMTIEKIKLVKLDISAVDNKQPPGKKEEMKF